MVVLKNKLENLKPGRQYILSVRSKNADLNVLSGYTDTIRFEVPADSTIPDAITNLKLFSGLENVMFVFDYSEDLDIDKYEYQLYENEDMSDEDGPLTGFADANVFTVRVSNLRLEEDGEGLWPYWGRVRAVDTSGNLGPWTPLVETDPHTPLIDNQYIGSLTASKITAGTIGAHTINLNGSNSIIKSSTYDFSAATPSGWYIRGDGHLNFGGPNGITYNNSTVTIGTAVNVQAELSANSLTVGNGTYGYLIIDDNLGPTNSDFGIELGDPTYNYWYSNGIFRVGDASKYLSWDGTSLEIRGVLRFADGTTPLANGDAITDGSLGGVTIDATKIYIGTGTFNNSNTSFYVDNSGQFSLKNVLAWNGTTLTISGNVTIGGTTGSTIVAGAANGATALQPGQAASDVNSNVTTISGGKIRTGIIESTGYSYSSGNFSIAGTQINLDNGLIRSQNFSIDNSGNAFFKGVLNSPSGTIGGWTIGADALYVGLAADSTGIAYINTSGGAWFSAGVLTASVAGFGAPVTTGGSVSQNNTTISGGFTRGYLRNISYGATKPTSPVLGDIHFT